MHRFTRAELVVGVLAGLLGLLAAGIAWFLPISGSEARIYRDGRLIQTLDHSTSLVQFLGRREALGVVMMLALLALAVMVAATSHARAGTRFTLTMEWASAFLLTATSWATVTLFGYAFFPSVALALICALLGTIRQGQHAAS